MSVSVTRAPKRFALALALLLQIAAIAPAFACGCELNCPEGEEFSDDTERCELIEKPMS